MGRRGQENPGSGSPKESPALQFPGIGCRRDSGGYQDCPRAGGHGRWLAAGGRHCAECRSEVRLIQSLLKVFADPDHLCCEFAAEAAWLGAPCCKLPSMVALYERKTKSSLSEESTA